MRPISATRRSRERRSLRTGVIVTAVLLCCLSVSAALGQPAAGAAPSAPFWSESQRQIYNEAKARLDAKQLLTSRMRRDLEDVCDQLGQALRNSTDGSERSQIRRLLVGVDSYAVEPTIKYLLTRNTPATVRLQGIMILVTIEDPVKPKAGILAALGDPSPAVQLWALLGVAKKGYTEAQDEVKSLLLSPSQQVSLAAIDAVKALGIDNAQGYLVALADREASRRKHLSEQTTQLQTQLEALEAETTQSPEAQLSIDSLRRRINEFKSQATLVNLLIFRVGEALGDDGMELKGFLSDEQLERVIAGLKAKFPPPATS